LVYEKDIDEWPSSIDTRFRRYSVPIVTDLAQLPPEYKREKLQRLNQPKSPVDRI